MTYTEKRSKTSVEKYEPNGYVSVVEEIIDSFDIGDQLYSEDYDLVGKVIETSDYDGDVDDEGRSIFIEARVKLAFPAGVDGETIYAAFEDWIPISQAWRSKEEAMRS